MIKITMIRSAVLGVLLCTAASAFAYDAPAAKDLTKSFVDAGVKIDRLLVVEVGGIVVIRGRADDKGQAEEAGLAARRLGYERVANLIRVFEPPDDAAIERRAERALSIHRSLDGCHFIVDSQKGVLHVNGSVQHELQKDVAVQLLRNIDGVREVKLDLQRF